MSTDKYLTGIIVTGERKNGKGEIINPVFLKYHNIRNDENNIKRFMDFAKKNVKRLQYVNFYWKDSEEYAFRRYFELI
jgi:hypothetical protein